MVICSICSHSDWCDGGDRCDCQCHEVDLDDEFLEDANDEDEESIDDYAGD